MITAAYGHLPSLPTTEAALYRWIEILTAGYLAVVYVLRACRGKALFTEQALQAVLTRIFDAATFAASIMLLIGVADDGTLHAIGTTTPFLLVAGFGGLLYGFHALAKSD